MHRFLALLKSIFAFAQENFLLLDLGCLIVPAAGIVRVRPNAKPTIDGKSHVC